MLSLRLRAFAVLVFLTWSLRVQAQSMDAGVLLDASFTSPPSDGAAPPTIVGAVDVTVRSRKSEAKQLQESAEAVTVVDLAQAKRRSADLGEVLARTQGVSVRRSGGLGSNAEVSMAGLEGDQIRTLLDGVPLDRAGYPFGIANIPVTMLERVEIYRGVVPVRFGADALGGAINLVTDPQYHTHAGAGYQVGSFGTHRAVVNGRYRHRTGLVAGAQAFIDNARNDYPMRDIPVPNEDGTEVRRTIKRFHDAYRAFGAHLELGVVDKRWAKKLLVDGFAAGFDKEIQSNAVMTIPYGEVRAGENSYGATARYEVDLAKNVELTALANYVHRIINFEDLSPTNYRWTGEPWMRIGRGASSGGEISQRPFDQTTYEDGLYTRLQLSWTPLVGNTLRAAVTPQFATRTVTSDAVGIPAPLKNGLRSTLMTLVSGVEHQLDLFEDKLSNLAFAKSYYYGTSNEQHNRGTETTLTRSTHNSRFGVGDSLRYRFHRNLIGKVSYEYATRLPRPDELFGNGALISANNELKPEVSHNVNVGPRWEGRVASLGKFMADVNFFMRDTRDMIVLLGGLQFVPYRNIGNARGFGIENGVGWTSPGQWLRLDGTFTWQDIRNSSTSGPFLPMKGQRIPNRPYMFSSWGAAVHIPNLPGAMDALEPHYTGRWTKSYNRGWDIGDPEFFITLPNMVSHDVGLSYLFAPGDAHMHLTFDVSNIGNARLFDTFGVQRPGRAYYLTLGGEI